MEQSQHELVKASCRELQLLARRHSRVQALVRNLLVRYSERPDFPLRGRRSVQREFTLLRISSITGGPDEAAILVRILDGYPWHADASRVGQEIEYIIRNLKASTDQLREATLREPFAAEFFFDQLAETMLAEVESPNRLPADVFQVLFGAISALNERVSADVLSHGVSEAVRLMKAGCRNIALKGGIQAWHFTAAFLGLDEQSASFQRFRNGWITRDDF